MKRSTNSSTVVGIFKESFGNFPLSKLRTLVKDNSLLYEARVAVRELIEERETSPYIS